MKRKRGICVVIHQYQNNGYNIVLDVNSGAVHVVDQEAYDVIGALAELNEEHTPESLQAPETSAYLKERLGGVYPEEDLKDILEAVTELTEQGRLQRGRMRYMHDHRGRQSSKVLRADDEAGRGQEYHYNRRTERGRERSLRVCLRVQGFCAVRILHSGYGDGGKSAHRPGA